jgi:hypothetical protein
LGEDTGVFQTNESEALNGKNGICKGDLKQSFRKVGFQVPSLSDLSFYSVSTCFHFDFFCGSPDGMQTKLLGEP